MGRRKKKSWFDSSYNAIDLFKDMNKGIKDMDKDINGFFKESANFGKDLAKSGAKIAGICAAVSLLPDEDDEPIGIFDQEVKYRTPFTFPRVDDVLNVHLRMGHEDNSGQIHALSQYLMDDYIDARLIKVAQGPTFSRFIIQPNTARSAKILLHSQIGIGMALECNNLNIYQHGKYIVVDMPYKTDDVLIGDLIQSKAFRESTGLSVCMGTTVDGSFLIEDLAKFPHLLIGGATGGGKTVLIHDLIVSLLMKQTPDDIEIYMVDPKGNEFLHYAALGYCHLVTTASDALRMFNKLIVEMEQRYRMLMSWNAPDLEFYNRVSKKKLKRTVVFVDELADLMTSPYKKQIETAISRLSAKARAAGIHLVLATQNPTVKVVTSQIKANMTARIALRCVQRTQSMVILDKPGAEKLMGKGDMIYMSSAGEFTRVQAPMCERIEQMGVVDRLLYNQEKVKHKLSGGAKALTIATAVIIGLMLLWIAGTNASIDHAYNKSKARMASNIQQLNYTEDTDYYDY